jgi:hypothetical protein
MKEKQQRRQENNKKTTTTRRVSRASASRAGVGELVLMQPMGALVLMRAEGGMCASSQALFVGGRVQVRLAFWLDVRLMCAYIGVICILATIDAK